MRTPDGIGTVSLPLGPWTSSLSPILTLTPLGSGIGFLPTRDMFASLPDLAEHFAANAFFARARSGHNAFGRGENVDSQAAENARNLLRTDIDAAAGT